MVKSDYFKAYVFKNIVIALSEQDEHYEYNFCWFCSSLENLIYT